MGVIQKVIYVIIPLSVMIIVSYFLFFGGGGFSKAETSISKTTVGAIPNQSIYGDVPVKASIPDNHRRQINSLKDTITKMINSGKSDCFGRYEEFDALNEQGTSITMTYDKKNDVTDFLVNGGKGGDQIITDLLFSIKMRPCVIAGRTDIAETFQKKFIAKESVGANEYTYPADSIRIFGDNDYNEIRVTGLPPGAVNDQDNNLIDGGMLFTPGGHKICFFPTSDHTDSEDGLNDDNVGLGDAKLVSLYDLAKIKHCN